MSEPRVTVAIPTRNRAELLRQALGSVLDQSMAEIEVFVSDNASTDRTEEVVASFDDPRVSYLPLERNIGLQGNLSRCLGLGSAPYLALLFDDDIMLPGALERKAGVLDDHPEVGMVESAFHVIGPDGRVLHENVSFGAGDSDMVGPGNVFIRRAFEETFRIMASPLYRRTAIDGDRFEEADQQYCDFGLFLRVALRANVAFIAEPLLALRFHEGSVTVQSGLAKVDSGSYRANFDHIALDQKVKMRFLRQNWKALARPRELRALARRWARRELLELVKHASFPQRRLGPTVRLLSGAARVEPTVLFTKDAIRYLMASAIGPRGRNLLRRARARLPSEAES
jgi:glycosyltransferase involved in cell wall biosynthesis